MSLLARVLQKVIGRREEATMSDSFISPPRQRFGISALLLIALLGLLPAACGRPHASNIADVAAIAAADTAGFAVEAR